MKELVIRTAKEKRRIRALVKKGKARIVGTRRENYRSHRRLISYEAWIVDVRDAG